MATVDLDALRAELEAAGLTVDSFVRRWAHGSEPAIRVDFPAVDDESRYICVGAWGNVSASIEADEPAAFTALAIIARHLGHGPAPLTEEEVEALCDAAYDGAGEASVAEFSASWVIDAVIAAWPKRFGVRREEKR